MTQSTKRTVLEWIICTLVPLVLCDGLAAEPAIAGDKAAEKQSDVSSFLADWHDAARDRDVPAKIHYPKPADGKDAGKCPVIIFSHGLGGSREGYAYLGQHWAAHGYVSVHLQHIGSDDGVWKDAPLGERMAAMRKSAANAQNAINRPKDVTFAIDQLKKLNEDEGPLKGRLDLERIGMSGHSFGGYTTLASAGEVFVVGGREMTLADPRIKAAIPMSAPAPKTANQREKAFAKLAVPCLHMTGTLDDSPIGDTKAADRRVPFDLIPATADQYLIILTGGDHMVFGGRTRQGLLGGAGNASKDATFRDLICQSTTAFWDAYLKGDKAARTWLTEGACKQTLGENATLEMKLTK